MLAVCRCSFLLMRMYASLCRVPATATATRHPVGAAGMRVVGVAAGSGHSLAVMEEGRVFAWGAAASGRLGLGRRREQRSDGEDEGAEAVKAEGDGADAGKRTWGVAG